MWHSHTEMCRKRVDLFKCVYTLYYKVYTITMLIQCMQLLHCSSTLQYSYRTIAVLSLDLFARTALGLASTLVLFSACSRKLLAYLQSTGIHGFLCIRANNGQSTGNLLQVLLQVLLRVACSSQNTLQQVAQEKKRFSLDTLTVLLLFHAVPFWCYSFWCCSSSTLTLACSIAIDQLVN